MSPDLLTQYVYATRPISKDEEITIACKFKYFYSLTQSLASNARHKDAPPLNPTSTRQSQLLSTFHFTCTCRRCSNPKESDNLLAEINTLTSLLTDWSSSSRTKNMRQVARKLIASYEQEGLEGFLGTPYGHAAIAHNADGDADGAKRYAKLAKEAGDLQDGPSNPNAALWNSMMEKPEGHWSWKRRI
jgi:hypothetical protein